jgi:hypothetical protein
MYVRDFFGLGSKTLDCLVSVRGRLKLLSQIGDLGITYDNIQNCKHHVDLRVAIARRNRRTWLIGLCSEMRVAESL